MYVCIYIYMDLRVYVLEVLVGVLKRVYNWVDFRFDFFLIERKDIFEMIFLYVCYIV